MQRYQPQLFMTIAGPTETLTGGGSAANSGIVGVGLCINDADSTLLIWRAVWLLRNQAGAPTANNDSFARGQDMADFQLYTRSQIDSTVNGWLNDGAGNVVPKTMTVPPTDLDGLQKLWKCLALYCTNVTIAWTDGTLSYDGTTLMWYSKDCPKDTNWRTRTAATATPAQPEYNAKTAGSPDLYRAMWTHENQTNWPTQVKIRFTLKDPQMPEDIRGMDYEVICPIGR
ncbi:MAG: hypothetical protein EHM48_04975 [Planctomycetaceae bacterium]|nr:MAG: hypothetical protein EHM48_04975 [Planctomycetaceae bacterium]